MKKLGIALAGLFVALQFVPAAPPMTNPPVEKARSFETVMQPPAGVAATLRRACYDCHSNETAWPWYSHVAPVGWLVRQHVAEGRKQLNFSEWLLAGETGFNDWSGFEKICTEVRSGSMPMADYVRLHSEAELSEADRQAVCAWVNERLPKR